MDLLLVTQPNWPKVKKILARFLNSRKVVQVPTNFWLNLRIKIRKFYEK